MLLLIDNYDSFTYNLAQYLGELGAEVNVYRNDALTLPEIDAWQPDHIVISPGPCTPAEAGISTEVVRRFGPTTPILGVCLGHQCIGAAYGGDVVRAGYPMHGKTSLISHDGSGIFAGLPSPLRVARYHSLVIKPETMPADLRVMATANDDGAVMAFEHREHPVIGVQFHPESAATEYGYAIVARFMGRDRARIDALPRHADGAMTARELFLPWTPSEDMRWRPFVPPPNRS